MATSAALVVVIMVSGADPGADLPRALQAAALQALPAGSEVVMAESDHGDERACDALVTLEIQGKDGVHMLIEPQARPGGPAPVLVERIARSFRFAASDETHERGRSLGYFLAVVLTGRAPPAAGLAVAAAPAPAAPAVVVPAPLPWMLDAGGLVAAGIDGAAEGLGAVFRVRRAVTSAGGVLVSGALAGRFGDIRPAQASVTITTLSLGVTLRSRPARAMPALGVGLRAELGGQWLRVAHLSDDDPTTAAVSRFLPAASAVAEVTWALGDALAVFAAGGVEGATGTTTLNVRQRDVAVIPRGRVLGEMGVQVRF